MSGALPVRRAVRVLLLDTRGRSLWFCYPGTAVVDPADPAGREYWAMPGGGLEQGESHERAARRELREELGLAEVRLRGCFAVRRAVLRLFDTVLDVRERLYWASWPGEDPERLVVQDPACLRHRWWEPAAMLAEQGVFVPRGVVPLAAEVASGREPGRPARLTC